MKQELKARLARLGQGRGISRVHSGSPADLVLRPADGLARVKTISAMEALVRRGMALLKAKRAIEVMVEHGEVVVHVPTIESLGALAGELCIAGVAAKRLAHTAVDVKAIRAGLGLTQEQFALRFGLDIDALQNWEQGRCMPDKPALAYLRAIAAAPREVAAAQEGEMA